MAERRKAWYQCDPYPRVVEVLLDRELLAEGGTASLRLAARVVNHGGGLLADDPDRLASALASEQTPGRLARGPLSEAAQDIVDALVEWRAPS